MYGISGGDRNSSKSYEVLCEKKPSASNAVTDVSKCVIIKYYCLT